MAETREPKIGTHEWAEKRAAETGESKDIWLRRARGWKAHHIRVMTEEIRQELEEMKSEESGRG